MPEKSLMQEHHTPADHATPDWLQSEAALPAKMGAQLGIAEMPSLAALDEWIANEQAPESAPAWPLRASAGVSA